MKRITVVLITLLIAASCAKQAPNPLNGMTDETFRKWMTKNAPNAKELENDIYIEYVERGSDLENKPEADTTWVLYDYEAYTLDGTVALTRNEATAKLVGSWTYSTHWADDFSILAPYSTTINPPLRLAIMKMCEGDSARVYIPGKFTNRYLINDGYRGEFSKFDGKPIYFDVRLKKVIHKVRDYEKELMATYLEKWGQTMEDSIIDGVFFRKTLDLNLPADDTIAKSENVKVDFSEYFLDGFLVKTSLDSLAKALNRYSTDSQNQHNAYFASYTISPENFDNQSYEIEKRLFSRMLKILKRGEEGEIVCTSVWTEKGIKGNFASKPQILPFTPRMYKIKVEPKEEEEEEDEEEDNDK